MHFVTLLRLLAKKEDSAVENSTSRGARLCVHHTPDDEEVRMELMGPELAFGLLAAVAGGRIMKPEGDRPEEKPLMDRLREIKQGPIPGHLITAERMCAAAGLSEVVIRRIITEL